MKEPQFITLCRELVARPQTDREFGITVVAPKGTSFKGIGIRPELRSENQNGDRVYRVTRKQAKKMIRIWEAHV